MHNGIRSRLTDVYFTWHCKCEMTFVGHVCQVVFEPTSVTMVSDGSNSMLSLSHSHHHGLTAAADSGSRSSPDPVWVWRVQARFGPVRFRSLTWQTIKTQTSPAVDHQEVQTALPSPPPQTRRQTLLISGGAPGRLASINKAALAGLTITGARSRESGVWSLETPTPLTNLQVSRGRCGWTAAEPRSLGSILSLLLYQFMCTYKGLICVFFID